MKPMRIHAISNLSLALMSTLLGLSFGLRAQSDSVESLRHEIDDLRREIQNDPKTYLKTSSFDPIEQPLAESVVLTKSGNLRIGGLVQFWYTRFNTTAMDSSPTPKIRLSSIPIRLRTSAVLEFAEPN